MKNKKKLAEPGFRIVYFKKDNLFRVEQPDNDGNWVPTLVENYSLDRIENTLDIRTEHKSKFKRENLDVYKNRKKIIVGYYPKEYLTINLGAEEIFILKDVYKNELKESESGSLEDFVNDIIGLGFSYYRGVEDYDDDELQEMEHNKPKLRLVVDNEKKHTNNL